MKYEGHLLGKGLSTSRVSKIPLKASSDAEAIEKFKRLRLAHGKSTVLILKLMKTDDDGQESEIKVP